jgi:hypothetical protein
VHALRHILIGVALYLFLVFAAVHWCVVSMRLLRMWS